MSFAPPGREPLRLFLTWLVNETKHAGVKFHLETEVTSELLKLEDPDEVIVTIGAIPIMPDIPGIDLPHVVTGEQVLMGEVELGKRVLVIGAGGAGVEVAHFIAMRNHINRDLKAHLQAYGGYDAIAGVIRESGHDITLVGRNPKLGTGLGPATRWVLVEELGHDGVTSIPSSKVSLIGNAATSQFALLPKLNEAGTFTKITQRIRVRIDVEQEQEALKPGMMVEVFIDPKEE